MKVKLYRATNAKGFVDEFSLYFPYPKWMKEEIYKRNGGIVNGTFLGCSQDSRGYVIRCCWDELDASLGYTIQGLGRRYPLEKMSEHFQNYAKHLEKLWNDAIKFNDEEHWDAWVFA